jgi:hypothetical protein
MHFVHVFNMEIEEWKFTFQYPNSYIYEDINFLPTNIVFCSGFLIIIIYLVSSLPPLDMCRPWRWCEYLIHILIVKPIASCELLSSFFFSSTNCLVLAADAWIEIH